MARFFLSVALLLLLLLSAHAHGGGQHDDDGDSGVDQSPTKPELRSKSLVLVKIWCLILVFLATFIGGISPYFLKWNQGFLVLGTQFAGGVFLGTALMHFLSDSNETFEDLAPNTDYPFAFMLSCVGYLLTMLADCIISHKYGKQESHQGDVQSGKNSSNSGESRIQVDEAKNAQLEKAQGALQARSVEDSVLLIMALCFHSVFEGIAIGIAETAEDAWRALWTVSLHKVFAAVAMGIALLRMIPDRPLLSCVAYAFAFAISSPIGVAIGIIIDATTEGAVADWIYAISMGFACGVFIYVSINHLLSKGFSPACPVRVDTPHARLLAVLLGVGVIAVVMIWD